MRRILCVLSLTLAPALAGAHPLGNFTINRYAALRVAPQALAVRYVVDMAELPAFRELRLLDADHDGTITAGEREAYLAIIAPALARGVTLRADGAPLALDVRERSLEVAPGAGGLPTLRVEVAYAAALPSAKGRIEFDDRNYEGRPGWREVIAVPATGIALSGASVPAIDRSQALRVYPENLLEAPLEVSTARFGYAPGGVAAGAEPSMAAGTRAGASRFADRLTELVATRTPLTPGLIVTSLLVAACLGALHALSPGHGKTIVGAYLVGARGKARHALFLGLVVTATHTLGVYLLGLATLMASHYVVPERLFPWISMVSGLLVVSIGASLVRTRLRAALDDHAHDHHHHHEHDHGHGHTHEHAHGHSHLPPEGTPVGLRSLLALGISGGLLPCPSALVVMLGAIALGRVGFGLLLIVAFSTGLAAVLTAVGLVLVYARQLFDRLPMEGWLARYVPVASALVISIAGLAILAQALSTIGA